MLESFFTLYSHILDSTEHLFHRPETFSLGNFLQIVLVILIIVWAYSKFIKDTHAAKLVKGFLLIIGSLWVISFILMQFHVEIIGQIIQNLITGVLFSMVIVFQPELRKLYFYLGETKFMKTNLFANKTAQNEKETNIIKEITEAVKYCSRVKRGSLIVIQKTQDSALYNDVGTIINSDISAELILTIFFPSTPLHDGALVIHKNKIVAAGVLLPLTKDPKLSWRYGTRHRAAIGASEISDSICIIVSEETGDISIAIDGILRKYDDITTFKDDLEKLLTVDNDRNIENSFTFSLLKFRKKK